MKLSGKVAVVTGSSRGIGKAIALGFAAEDAGVVIAARTEIDNENYPGNIYKTANAIKAMGCRALPVKCEVTDEQSVNDMVRKTMEQFGQIDILVNNAGIAYPSTIVETPLKRLELILKVNLIGAFLCSKAVLPLMFEQESGSIINISSRAADERVFQTADTGVIYAVSKAGLDRFTYGLAAEVAKYNIAVNAIKPEKVVDTEGMRIQAADTDKIDWQSPEKMVKCAVFLAA
jgi:citronellol/citronellal dehydrogenase